MFALTVSCQMKSNDGTEELINLEKDFEQAVVANDAEAIGNLTLSASPLAPGSRSMKPSSKCDFWSAPVHNLMHRIMVSAP